VTRHSGQFQPGDPRIGTKPKGSKHQRTILLEALKADSSNEAEFASKILKLAESGNSTALTVVASRLWKQSKASLDTFELPEAENKIEHADNIIDAMAAGSMSPDMAVAAMSALRGASELTEIKEIMEMLKDLEGK